METSEQFDMRMIKREFTLMVERARELGYIVTVEQVPLQPLAMGNHTDKVTVRKVHNS